VSRVTRGEGEEGEEEGEESEERVLVTLGQVVGRVTGRVGDDRGRGGDDRHSGAAEGSRGDMDDMADTVLVISTRRLSGIGTGYGRTMGDLVFGVWPSGECGEGRLRAVRAGDKR
jgi:hypothetical protein